MSASAAVFSHLAASGYTSTQMKVEYGSLMVAVPIALAAGLVSFLSPCVLPLVPGYLSYVTGLTGADLGGEQGATSTAAGASGTTAVIERTRTAHGGRVLVGSTLFVLGFSAVFVSAGALFGGVGAELRLHQDFVNRALGVVTIVMGIAFLGFIPRMQREFKVHRLPTAGLAGAPVLGVLFGVGWTPCLGPTLAAVQTLAYTSASAGRGALLTVAYCLGLGVPFVLTGLAFRRALGAFAFVKRHYAWVMRIGGGMLILL